MKYIFGGFYKMKNKWCFSIGLILFLNFIPLMLFAQTHNDGQRLVGTWIFDEDNSISITFNSNGTFLHNDGRAGEWYIDENKIILFTIEVTEEYFLSISPDGRRIIFINDEGERIIYRKRN